MTINNLYILMAREVTTDAADNLTSILKIIDTFNFGLDHKKLKKDGVKLGKQVITLPATYAAATAWIFSEKLEEDTFFNFRLNILDPTGKKLESGAEQENLLPAGIDKFNMSFNVQGLPVTSAGKYKMQAEVLSKEGKPMSAASYPFEVTFDEKTT